MTQPKPRAHNFIDITGNRYASLVAVSHVRRSRWLFVCDCGSKIERDNKDVKNGHTKSCGCQTGALISRALTKHGHSHRGKILREWRIWSLMFRRCVKQTDWDRKYYGTKGIKICERWNSFENFLEDMGPAPSKRHSLDRIDNNGNYEPGNCRWATMEEQMQNTSKTRLNPQMVKGMRALHAEGASYAEITRKFGFPRTSVVMAIKRITWQNIE